MGMDCSGTPVYVLVTVFPRESSCWRRSVPAGWFTSRFTGCDADVVAAAT